MKKRLLIGVFVLIAIFSLTSFTLADDNDEKAFGLIAEALKMANKHEYEKMVDLCTQAIMVAPNLSLGYLTRAKGYSALGQSEKSYADYQKSIELAKIEANKTPDLAKKYKKKDTVDKRDKTVADREPKGDTGYSVYFRPGIRFGSDSRTLYIMDLLVPFYQDDSNIVFGNIKYTPNSNNGWEINAGVGYRRLFWDDKLILGANVYYDQRKTDWGTDHNQLGMGLEAMSDIPLEPFALGLTARFNYYHPLSDAKIDGLGTEYANYFLSNTGIIFDSGRVEEPMRGIDYEAGVRIPYLSDYVETWAYVGGYNYFGKIVDDINGFQARLEVIPTDFIRLNYEFHHDNYSKAQHYGEVTLEVPFSIGNLVTGRNPFEGIGDMMTRSRELKERMVEPTRRDVDVKVVVDEDNGNIPGVGGQVEDVVFVSETGSDVTGDGTKNNPYATVSYALANNAKILAGTVKTIHVMNSSAAIPVDEAAAPGSLTLSIADFLLWGSGANHPKYSNIINMPYTGHPTINNTLELNAANLEVTGLGFDGNSSGYCIDILAGAGGSGIRITNNLFEISRAWFAVGINSTFTGSLGTERNPAIISGNTFNIESTGNVAYGIHLYTYGADNDIFAKITGNDMSGGILGDTESCGIYLISSTGSNIGSETRPVIISGNTINVRSNNNGACGIHFYTPDYIFAEISKNYMSNIQGNSYAVGCLLYVVNGGIFADINKNYMNVVSNTNAYGAYLRSGNLIGNASLTTRFNGNYGTIDGAITRYILWLEDAGGTTSSYVNWAGNVFTPENGGAPSVWSGNYPNPYPANPGLVDSIDITNFGGTIIP